jgi:hypothetical protein
MNTANLDRRSNFIRPGPSPAGRGALNVLFLCFSLGFICSALRAQSNPTPGNTKSDQVTPNLDDGFSAQVALHKEAIEEVFRDALNLFHAGDHDEAAAGFWSTIVQGGPGNQEYPWARYLLAECLRTLNFWDAATHYYYLVAQTRDLPEVLPDALGQLEIIYRTRPHNKALLNDSWLSDTDLGSISAEVDPWIHFQKGRSALFQNLHKWSKSHFSAIPKNNYYDHQASFVQAMRAFRNNKMDKGRERLQQLAQNAPDDAQLMNEVHLALGRHAFDTDKYKLALQHYSLVTQRDLSFQQATLLLEKAWTYFQLNQPALAMGLLHSLEAPSYNRYFIPDAYFLRALIFKNLCHFLAAKRTLRKYRRRFALATQDLRARIPLHTSHDFVYAAVQEEPLASHTAFIRTLEKEHSELDNHKDGWEISGLYAHLKTMYSNDLNYNYRQWKDSVRKEGRRHAEEFLDLSLQINLLDYEIDLDLFHRRAASKRPEAHTGAPRSKATLPTVRYIFQNEYWNDELHTYRYSIVSRCDAEPNQ